MQTQSSSINHSHRATWFPPISPIQTLKVMSDLVCELPRLVLAGPGPVTVRLIDEDLHAAPLNCVNITNITND